MKRFTTKISLSLAILSLGMASFARADEASELYVARPSGQLSCSPANQPTNLGWSVNALETQSVEVLEAKWARLRDRMTCMGCQCPDGTYHVAKVVVTPELSETLSRDGWEVVSPADLIPVGASRVRSNDVNRDILPVIPER